MLKKGIFTKVTGTKRRVNLLHIYIYTYILVQYQKTWQSHILKGILLLVHLCLVVYVLYIYQFIY